MKATWRRDLFTFLPATIYYYYSSSIRWLRHHYLFTLESGFKAGNPENEAYDLFYRPTLIQKHVPSNSIIGFRYI